MYLFIYVLYQIVQHYSKAQQTWSLKIKKSFIYLSEKYYVVKLAL